MSTTLHIGHLEIDPDVYRATLGGRDLKLTPSQLEVLAFLIAHRDRVATRSELARAAGLEDGKSVDVALSGLRRVLGDGVLRNVRSRGWIIEPASLGG